MKINKLFCFALLSAMFVSRATTAMAVPIPLFNTGTDIFNVAWGSASVSDIHYTVTASPLGAFVPVSANAFPGWVPNNASSSWISSNSSGGGASGTYTYETTFTLPANATNVSLSGLWATDDPGNLFINGSSAFQSSPDHKALRPFSVTSGFILGGLNKLQFVVQNGGSATGLRVDQILGSFTVPEPSAGVIAVIAMSAGGFALRRKSKWLLPTRHS